MQKTLKIGMIGLGVVGSSVAKILKANQKLIMARCGCGIEIKKAIIKDPNKKRDSYDFPITNQPSQVLNDPEIDIIVELTGGISEPFEIAKEALKKGKGLITANKAMLAYHRYELQNLANNTPIGFEASVAGGIPIIKALRDGLGANEILSIKGIMNGTCNFILTKMKEEGLDYQSILKEAQRLGYAECDPSFDVKGIDAAHKLLILASIAYNIDAKPEDILIEGITEITQDDLIFAKEFDYHLKLLGIAKKHGHEIELRVHPTLIPKQAIIGKVDGVMNAISVIGDNVGETLYYGPGAGGEATASAVIADIIEIARTKSSPMLGFKQATKEPLKLKPIKDIQSAYYIRLEVLDEPGVLASIASLFAKQKISIDTLLQKNTKTNEHTMLFLSTHQCFESQIQNALSSIQTLDIIKAKPVMIRIEKD